MRGRRPAYKSVVARLHAPGTSIQSCRWNCQSPNCPAGTVFADGCYSTGGPVVCPAGYVFTSSPPYGAACCPAPTPTPIAERCVRRTCESWQSFNLDICDCQPRNSPVLIDTAGDGFDLTDAAGGVTFDLDGDGTPEGLSWTSAGSDDAWLALGRDGDGRVDDGRELFGDLTPQPPSGAPDGFLALPEYDRPERGGNSDGVIDARDAVFASLRLWRDANHDGVSQPAELHALHVARIHLDYRESRRTDRFGNRFRYRAKVEGARGAEVGRWAWDVFLVGAR